MILLKADHRQFGPTFIVVIFLHFMSNFRRQQKYKICSEKFAPNGHVLCVLLFCFVNKTANINVKNFQFKTTCKSGQNHTSKTANITLSRFAVKRISCSYKSTSPQKSVRPRVSNLSAMAGRIDFILCVAGQYAISAAVKAMLECEY